MIAQNDALDEQKKIVLSKIFFGPPKNGPWGPKMAIFGPKLPVLAKNGDFWWSKNFQKICFCLKIHFRPFQVVTTKKVFCKKNFVPLIVLALVLGPHRYIYIYMSEVLW